MRRHGREARQHRALLRLRRQADVTLSPHAQQRALELGFHETDVLRCVLSPEQTYGGDPRHPKGRRTYQRRDCACIIDTAHRIVVTVLLRHAEPWRHGTHTRRAMPTNTRPPLLADLPRDHPDDLRQQVQLGVRDM
jgi:hypothetical protein